MYIKFNFRELEVRLTGIWQGKIINLVNTPEIIERLPCGMKPDTEHVNKVSKEGFTDSTFYLNCHNADVDTLLQAIRVFQGKILHPNVSASGFCLESVNPNQYVFDGKDYLPSLTKDAYLTQFHYALGQIKPMRHRFFRHPQKHLDPSVEVYPNYRMR